MVVAGGIPAVQAGNTVVVQSSQSSMHGYPGMFPYPVEQPPCYADNQGLVKNMAI